MAAGVAKALSGSLSGGSRNSGRASSLAAAQGLASRIGGRNNMLDTALASIQASQPPVNPGFDRDPNNLNQGSASIVSEADANSVTDRNSGAGVLTQGMHEMNSSKPIVATTNQNSERGAGMGYSSVRSPFSPAELNTGNGIFGSDMQRQNAMNPVPLQDIDSTGMNSLYGGPLTV